MKLKEHKTAVYCAGLLITLSVWLIMFAGALSAFSLFRTALLIILSYIAMVIDINTKQIPNALILAMIAGWLLLITPMVFLNTENGIRILVDSVYGLLLGGGLFLLVYLLSRKGLGGGDVKFMSAAGLYLGFSGTIPVILFGTIIAALTGLVLILLKKINRKDSIPLAPFLFIGIIITVFLISGH
jgi:prepilin signal peptidase PulO-like enzyme (type II secretory pathway)